MPSRRLRWRFWGRERMVVDWGAVLWSAALSAAGAVVVHVGFIALVFWLGARIASVIAGGVRLLGVYLPDRAVAG